VMFCMGVVMTRLLDAELHQRREEEGQQISGKSGDWIRGMIPSHIETFVSDHRGSPNPVGGPLFGPLWMLKTIYPIFTVGSNPFPPSFGIRKLFAPGLRSPVTSCHKLALPVHLAEGLTG